MQSLSTNEFAASYLVVPRATCENWEYLPTTFTNKINAGNYWYISPESDLFQFGVLNSSMYMAWIKCVAGRLNCYDRNHHSPTIRNFPWPITHTLGQISAIEEKALGVLKVRAQFPAATLAELYNPATMPAALQDAHKALDNAVDEAYSHLRFPSDDSRVGFLLSLQHKLSMLLINMYDDTPEMPEASNYDVPAFKHYSSNGSSMGSAF